MLSEAKNIDHALFGDERLKQHAQQALASPSLRVAVARVSRAAQCRLECSARRRCSAAGILANTEGERLSRQRLILEALADTRAALSEILRIDLGKRYQLQLEISDWEGWPRLELRLIDSLADFIPGFRGVVKEHLSSGAIDRSGQGMMFLALNYREVLGRLVVGNEEDLASLPQTVLEGVQHFLGRVAAAAQEALSKPADGTSKTGNSPALPNHEKTPSHRAPMANVEAPPAIPTRKTSAHALDQDVDSKLAKLSFFSD
jgi:hypothetical protein